MGYTGGEDHWGHREVGYYKNKKKTPQIITKQYINATMALYTREMCSPEENNKVLIVYEEIIWIPIGIMLGKLI